jgi:hypothetical protein
MFSSIKKPNSFWELPYRLDVEKLSDLVRGIDEATWDEYDFRQNTFEVHKKTKTIPLLCLPETENPFLLTNRLTKPPLTEEFLSLGVRGCVEFLENYYSGVVSEILLVKLLKNSTIPVHQDYGSTLGFIHRIHIPLISNENVFFTVNDDTINMKCGSLYEINNQETHGVSNLSKHDRVHIIIDIFENKTLVEYFNSQKG